MEAKYFRERFNTKLDQENEKRFQAWVEDAKSRYGTDLSMDLDTYDLRGYWFSGGYKDEAFKQRKGHAPDTYKKPNHPTFSKESIYSGTKSEYGGNWEGGNWKSETEFEPTAHMLQHTHPLSWYIDYMRKNGEGVKIMIPNSEIKKIIK